MSTPKTISFAKGRGNLNHNNRVFIAKNVDAESTPNNIIILQENLEEAYEKNFGKAIEEYNLKQKRKDRCKTIKSYMDEIKRNENSKGGIKLFYEQVIQLGTMYDTGNKTDPVEAEKAAKALTEYCYDFLRRNPRLYVFNAVIHMDEATPHLHIDFIPVAKEGAKRGLKIRNSFAQALREQGIIVVNADRVKRENEFTVWRKSEIEAIKKVAEKHRILVKELSSEKREHLTPDEYRKLGQQATAKAEKEVQQKLTGLQEKNILLQKANEILSEKVKQLNASQPKNPDLEKEKTSICPVERREKGDVRDTTQIIDEQAEQHRQEVLKLEKEIKQLKEEETKLQQQLKLDKNWLQNIISAAKESGKEKHFWQDEKAVRIAYLKEHGYPELKKQIAEEEKQLSIISKQQKIFEEKRLQLQQFLPQKPKAKLVVRHHDHDKSRDNSYSSGRTMNK